MQDWLEWEELVLRPAVLSKNSAALEAALGRLDAAVTAKHYVAGPALTLADIAILSDLCSLSGQAKVGDGDTHILSNSGTANRPAISSEANATFKTFLLF